MADSKMTKRARKVIEIITTKLDPQLIQTHFDEPIAQAVRDFHCQEKDPLDYRCFHEIISAFVRAIYDDGLKAPFSIADPLAQAIYLLSTHYQSDTYGNGYIAALMDACDSNADGIQKVRTELGEIIKQLEKSKYVKAVFAEYIGGCDWYLRCEIARVLLEDYRSYLPHKLQQCVPEQLANELPLIINMHIRSGSTLEQIFYGKPKTLSNKNLLQSRPLQLRDLI